MCVFWLSCSPACSRPVHQSFYCRCVSLQVSQDFHFYAFIKFEIVDDYFVNVEPVTSGIIVLWNSVYMS